MDAIAQLIDKIQPVDELSEERYCRQRLAEDLDKLLEMSVDITGAMVSRLDGHALAQRLVDGFDAKRFAAMSSALHALSSTLALEAEIGVADHVLIEGGNGYAYLLKAGNQLVLTVITASKSNVGMNLAMARMVAMDIAEHASMLQG